MGIMKAAGSLVGNIFSAGAKDLAEVTFKGVDSLITSAEEKGEQTISLEVLKNERERDQQNYDLSVRKLEFEINSQTTKDRQDARAMYKDDSSLQKVFAIVFLIGYIGITIAIIAMVFGIAGMDRVELNAIQASIITMVFTAMSTKIGTVTDFLFGGSKTNDDSEKKIAAAFNKT